MDRTYSGLTRHEVEARLFEAAKQLAQSDKGRDALRRLLDWFDNGGGLSLDYKNQRAFSLLLAAAWCSYPGAARDQMRFILEDYEQ
jgi:hypothetical protein